MTTKEKVITATSGVSTALLLAALGFLAATGFLDKRHISYEEREAMHWDFVYAREANRGLMYHEVHPAMLGVAYEAWLQAWLEGDKKKERYFVEGWKDYDFLNLVVTPTGNLYVLMDQKTKAQPIEWAYYYIEQDSLGVPVPYQGR